MKKALTLIVLLFFYTSELFAQKGSFIFLYNAYLYKNPEREGKKGLNRRRQAFKVIDIKRNKNDQLMYQIVYTPLKDLINGSGYILETDNELQAKDNSLVKVYEQVPKKNNSLSKYIMVPVNQLSFSGKQESSLDFREIDWRAVNYKAIVPRKYWIISSAGIYRVDKDPVWLNKTYQKLRKNKYPRTTQRKVLMGLVENGITMDQVLLTLGEPEKINTSEDKTESEWIYSDKKIIFKDNIVLHAL